MEAGAPSRTVPVAPPEHTPRDELDAITARLSASERLLFHGSVASDIALRTAVATTLSVPMIGAALTASRRAEERQLEFYADLARQGNADAVFASPEPVDVRVTEGRDLGLPGGRVDLLRFDSPYVALNPELKYDL